MHAYLEIVSIMLRNLFKNLDIDSCATPNEAWLSTESMLSLVTNQPDWARYPELDY